MVDSGIVSTQNIELISSVYFVTYAVGQFINGSIGDKIKAKYMICFGFVFVGVCILSFSMETVSFICHIL